MKIKKSTSFWDKVKGLMFADKIRPVYFETRFGIHTFFVKKPIDVFVLDDNFIVKIIKRGLKPWRIFVWNPKYKIVLEVPVGHMSFKKVAVGEKISSTL